MEFKIRVLEQTEEGLFAEVLDEKGNRICLGDGINPYAALEDACLVFADILKDCSEREEQSIARMISERCSSSDEEKFSIRKAIDMLDSK